MVLINYPLNYELLGTKSHRGCQQISETTEVLLEQWEMKKSNSKRNNKVFIKKIRTTSMNIIHLSGVFPFSFPYLRAIFGKT